METTLGGERLGSGNQQKIHLRNYERSTHDLSYVWRSTMASGTLVPFMSEVALPGDTFDINLNCDVLTHPTIGPLFGSYKVQLDVFQIPIRLYQASLHMNKLGIGMKMATVKLPQLRVTANNINPKLPIDNQQINPSSLLSYLNIRGLGHTDGDTCSRWFNAIPYLGYWEIYKNYYANKQEEIGAMIHADVTKEQHVTRMYLTGASEVYVISSDPKWPPFDAILTTISYMEVGISNLQENYDTTKLHMFYNGVIEKLDDLFTVKTFNLISETITYAGPTKDLTPVLSHYIDTHKDSDQEPIIKTFPLENIDLMREDILTTNSNTRYEITNFSIEPYSLPLQNTNDGTKLTWSAITTNQEGLALKTYQSDLFNNWISTEWIDGDNGINQITAIDTSEGSFTIDELNMSNKIYNMLNRIALSGGSYDDWLDAVYSHDRVKQMESPVYLGGLIKELVFQEVISNSADTTGEQPLGTLAGRGKLTNKHKGGNITTRISEPSYLMGIVSLTPRIDYSQGNKWDVNLKTMDDFHKPALDEIGFQDLITDQMAWFDTFIEEGATDEQPPIYKSAGKQPAWINYMTNVNQIRGNFAIQSDQMFMTLTRRYEHTTNDAGLTYTIKDLTTYIDPSKFNHIFANTRRDAQNFWVQIGLNITARRKMSAKVIPNL